MKLSILEEKALSNEMQKYPCLYDKSDPGYKGKDRKQNAWREIERALEFTEGMVLLIALFIILFYLNNCFESLELFQHFRVLLMI